MLPFYTKGDTLKNSAQHSLYNFQKRKDRKIGEDESGDI